MKLEIELTDEMLESALRRTGDCTDKDNYTRHMICRIADVIAAAVPEPTLKQRALKVIYPSISTPYMSREWNERRAVEVMARWLFENSGENDYSFIKHKGKYFSSYNSTGTGQFDNFVDALAHIVVGLEENSD